MRHGTQATWMRRSRCIDPDVIARAPAGWPEPGPFVGRDAVMQQFARLREAWASDALREVTEPRPSGTASSREWRGRARVAAPG